MSRPTGCATDGKLLAHIIGSICEDFGQGLPPDPSSFRQFRLDFGKVDRADSRIHQDRGNFVCSRFSIEKCQYGGGIENIIYSRAA
jgi:hypothetical protein